MHQPIPVFGDDRQDGSISSGQLGQADLDLLRLEKFQSTDNKTRVKVILSLGAALDIPAVDAQPTGSKIDQDGQLVAVDLGFHPPD